MTIKPTLPPFTGPTSLVRPGAIVLITLVMTMALGWAQEPPPSISDRPIRVDVDAVNLFVTVNHKRTGDFIEGLSADDFEIFEDDTLQEISNFTPQTNQPLAIALAVDTSSSVRIKLKFEKEVAADFVYSVMRPIDRALLVEFDTGVTLLHDYTSNPNDLAREIKALRAGGGTSLYDAVYLIAEQKMTDVEGRKTIVILSDGADQTSVHDFEDAMRLCYRAEATLFAISTTRLGADIDHEGDNALKQMTESTGGRTYYPVSTGEMAKAFEEINQILRNQYSVTYKPSNAILDGTFRRIKVKLRGVDDVIVRHRRGYYADVIER